MLVNNAAHASPTDGITDLTAEIIDETYAVNTPATFLLTTEVVRRYEKHSKGWGRIVNVSTGPAQCFVTQISYGINKAAVEAATRALARALGPIGITVNTVAPGANQTGCIDKELEEELLATTPLRRLAQPEDIANAILFLASDQLSFVTR